MAPIFGAGSRSAMADDELTQLTVAQLGRRIQHKAVSPVEVCQAFLAHIDAVEPKLNAFITRLDEQALEAARQAETDLAAGRHWGAFHGIPVGLKDLFWTRGVRTTSGSLVDADFVPEENGAVVAKLFDAGAYCIGKLNMPEFAFSPLSFNHHYGPARNPWDPERTTGGSSSGSGAAVASGGAPFALGTDAGGSVRIPSSLCGITGLKPTYGLVSRYGATPLSWTMDHVGPMARTVQDVALALSVLAGHDPRDAASLKTEPRDYTRDLDRSVRGLRIGVPKEYVWDAVDEEVEAAFKAAMAQMETLGAGVEDISIPELPLVDPAAAIIVSADAAACYGKRLLAEGDRFDPAIRRRIESGLFVSAEAYLQAQRVRELVGQKLREVFRQVDLLAMPTTAIPAPPIGQDQVIVGGQERSTREMLLRFTRIFNVTGLPAISVPCGFTAGNLPIGLQLAGKPLDDGLVMAAAHAYQQATEWHLRRPPL